MDTKMLVQMNETDLKELVRSVVKECIAEKAEKPQSATVRGIKGLKEIFHCGDNMAINIKKSGVINDAITQIGPQTFFTDVVLAKELWKKHYDKVKMGIV